MSATGQPSSSPPQVTVIVPTLNEAANIQPLLTRIFSHKNSGLDIQVLFVDDGSTDGTADRISSLSKSYPIQLLSRQNPRGGLAGAVVEAAAKATTRWVVVMDADLSHPPERIADLVAPLLHGAQDMVIGSRYAPGGRTPGWPRWRRCMSRGACLLAAPLTPIKDPLSGFFATRRTSILTCEGNPTGFKIALELIVRATDGFRVKEIPVCFQDRLRGQSKMKLRVLLIYLTRLGRLLGWQTVNDFRLFGRQLLGLFCWTAVKRPNNSSAARSESLASGRPSPHRIVNS